MSYQVLARKWRPRDFTTLVGQEHVVRALTHALEQQRLHHAYLFTGTRGVGKTTLSRILAKALNCTGVDGSGGITAEPCGQCKACQEIDSGRFVDYIEMDAASNRGVDEMAQLLDKAVYAPTVGRFKVYMIDEVHMLTNHAFNAMLKTLEEPPGHVKFILATTDPQKIPVTVLSRCLQFNLKQMPPGHIVSHLDHILGQEGITHDGNALRLLAQAAHGSMRDALSLTDQAIAYSAGQVSEDAVRGMLGAIDQSYLVQLLDALAAEDGATMIGIADSMADRSLSFAGALQDLGSLLHKVALAQAVPASVQDEWPEAGDVRRLAGLFDAQEVQLFYQIANIGRNELALAPDEYAGFTMTLLRMLAFRPSAATPAPVTGQGGGGQTARPRAPGVAAPAAAPAMRVAAAVEAAVEADPPAVVAVPEPKPGPAAVVAEIAPQPEASVGSEGVEKVERAAEAFESTPVAAVPDAAMSPARAALLAARQATAGRGGRSGAPAGAPLPAAAAKPAAPPARPAAQPLRPPAANRPAAAVVPAPATPAPNVAPSAVPSAVPSAAPSVAPRASERPQRAAQASDSVPPWEMAGGSDVPPWEEMPPDLPLIGPYGSDPGYDASMMFDAQDMAPEDTGRRASFDRGQQDRAPQDRAPQDRSHQDRAQQDRSHQDRAQQDRAQQSRASQNGGSPNGGSQNGRFQNGGFQNGGSQNGGSQHGGSQNGRFQNGGSQNGGSQSGGSQSGGSQNGRFQNGGSQNGGSQNGGSQNGGSQNGGSQNGGSQNDRSTNGTPRAAAASQPQAPAAPAVRAAPVAPAADADGTPPVFTGTAADWPALAASLPLRGLAQQLAYQSELARVVGRTVFLRVPVAAIAENGVADRMQQVLSEHFGVDVRVQCEIGAVFETAAAADAQARAERQREAEANIEGDPFVQGLLREFGGQIVPGSIQPRAA